MPDVRLPRLADTLVEGTVTHWLKHTGETVSEGEPLVEVETDKVNTELEAPASGILTEIVAEEGETVQVDALLARIEGPGDAGSSGSTSAGQEEEPPASTGDASTSPVQASGLDPMRRRIAERMQEARASIEGGAASLAVDVEGLHPASGWNAAFVKALAQAGGYRNVGIAVEVEGGLVVPVVHEAGEAPVPDLATRLRELAGRARAGTLMPADVAGGEVTVTNVGSTGTLFAFPLVNPGQPAILCPGQIQDGRLLLTLCYDRGAMDEATADALLTRTGEALRTLAGAPEGALSRRPA
ncbi:MAG: 2-oxo acid dehydrogenase subunit E2 [Candidatus Dormibacteraeota bacterium]|nr:2-oxo acid dehydrogenase subunit E2 [Candidatus Dormibacteraeota bacterium]